MIHKLKRKNQRKTRRIPKKSRKNPKKLRQNTKKPRKSQKKYYGGGDWIPNNNINYNEHCVICDELFRDTPNLAIYKSDCGHLFHNNCLNARCESNLNNWRCPICGEPISEDQCMDVWAFKNKSMNESDFNDNQIRGIYINQEDFQQE